MENEKNISIGSNSDRLCIFSIRGDDMSLIDLWEKSKAELQAKSVQQIISFAGNGSLTDESATSNEFRAFLKGISTRKTTCEKAV